MAAHLKLRRQPPTPPPQAVAAGLTKLIFDVDFTDLSQIDVNNTKAAGYKLYVNNGYPQANDTFANTITNAFAAAPATHAADFSVRSGGGVTLATDRTGLATGLQTCCWDGSQFVGTTFLAPFCVEIGMAFDPTLGVVGDGALGDWPAAWFWQKRGVDNSNTNLTDVMSEDANWEFMRTSSGSGAGGGTIGVNLSGSQYTMDYPNAPQGTSSWQINNDPIFSGGYSFLSDHVYSMVIADNGDGTGYIDRWIDNVHTANGKIDCSDTGGCVAHRESGLAFGSIVGQCRSFLTHPTIGILGTGSNWPCTFSKYRFWGPPP